MDFNNAYNLLIDKLQRWFAETIKLLPNIVLAVVVLIIGILIAKLVRKYSYKIIQKLSSIQTINKLFSSFTYIVVIIIAMFTALNIIGLDKAVTTVLAGAGILGLALAFAFQDVAANFMSGIFMSFRRPFDVGDLVTVNDKMGRIEAVNLRDTTLITLQGQRLIIPNKDVFQNAIENFSSTGKRRLDFTVGISYGDDLEKVRSLVKDCLTDLLQRDLDKEVEVFYDEFGDSSINFKLRIWLNSVHQADYLSAKSEAIILIKKAFDNNDIMIPFPIRTLDFGIKGGEKLSEMKLNLLDAAVKEGEELKAG
ncbi:mechanosensitive ion channel protein MscS [Pedobacter psychrophilus]|uniref:Mechanosensitive ion channel protein MscS n=1 Tax=Pedobacter psychrophilus TaxID=1826909 RepID=A0A179DL55_9SPHI|nr:mechanosensitive ion channel [Pedobacter psychrophilus]OAQ41614.1 mechanosensitive ion channel protein MscS [Pedobacter psychrophilus]